MKNIDTWAAKPARRTVAGADLRAGKGKRKLTQLTANTAEESARIECREMEAFVRKLQAAG